MQIFSILLNKSGHLILGENNNNFWISKKQGIFQMLKGVWVSIKRGYKDNQNLNRVIYVIIIHFLIKSLCFEPCSTELSFWFTNLTLIFLPSLARQQRTTADSIKLYIFYICIYEAKRQILFFVNKIMHNFKIGFKFVKNFFNSTLYFGRI